jgi:rhodanese-related sulfurtransferase
MRNVNQKEWRELVANDSRAVIIDVRTPLEWKDGIIENAQLMNVLELESFMEKVTLLEKEKNYYGYCRSGVRSKTACKILESAGVEITYNLRGGILDWAGEKVSRD